MAVEAPHSRPHLFGPPPPLPRVLLLPLSLYNHCLALPLGLRPLFICKNGGEAAVTASQPTRPPGGGGGRVIVTRRHAAGRKVHPEKTRASGQAVLCMCSTARVSWMAVSRPAGEIKRDQAYPVARQARAQNSALTTLFLLWTAPHYTRASRPLPAFCTCQVRVCACVSGGARAAARGGGAQTRACAPVQLAAPPLWRHPHARLPPSSSPRAVGMRTLSACGGGPAAGPAF